MRLKLISCDIFQREMAVAIARSINQINSEFLPAPAPQTGCSAMHDALQAALGRVDESQFQAILLGCGACAQQLAGLHTRSIPLVIPRAQNCRQGAWELKMTAPDGGALGIGDRLLFSHQMAALEQGRVGPLENVTGCANQSLQDLLQGIGPDWVERMEWESALEAQWFGWDFERGAANLAVTQRFVDGYWSYDEFLVVPPGWQVVARQQEGILAAEEWHA